MAIIDKKSILNQLTGQLGDQVVLRDLNGQKIASIKKSHNKKKFPGTPAQKKNRRKLTLASKYAQLALTNPANRERYEAAKTVGRTAYNMAVSDYMTNYDLFGEFIGPKKSDPMVKNSKLGAV